MYDGDAVFNPSFRLIPGLPNQELCRYFYMEAFFTLEDPDDPEAWYPDSED